MRPALQMIVSSPVPASDAQAARTGNGKAAPKVAVGADPQASSKPPRKQALIRAETFDLDGRPGFRMVPEAATVVTGVKPWIFYAPTLPAYPDEAERWMHERFLEAGIAVAGVDVGEAYGSPKAFPWFEALHRKMTADGYAEKPVLLGRSRGGLWASSWAIARPDRVAGIAGIYPVYDHSTYPGLAKAAPAYGLTHAGLEAGQEELNPIRRASVLAKARIPVFIIHGTEDTVVPLGANSGKLEEIYEASGAGDAIEVMRIGGQGHNFWPGFFRCRELVDFAVAKARAGAGLP